MLSQIRLVGCQSWEDCTINLSTDRLNVIAAPNNTGKSVLFKMLKITANPKYFPPRKRKKLIRWGHEYAQIVYGFSDGCMGAVRVYPTKVIYLFREKNSSWETGYEPNPKMLQELGLLVNRSGTFIANILDTDQDLLLVDSDSKSTLEFMDMLCVHPALEEFSARVEENRCLFSESRYKLENALNDVCTQLQEIEFVDIPKLQRDVDTFVSAKNLMYDCIEIANALEVLQGALSNKLDYEILLQAADSLLRLEHINFHKCIEYEYEPQLLSCCNLLQLLEGVSFSKTLTKEEPISLVPLELLEKLESLKFMRVIERSVPPDTRILVTLEHFESIAMSLKQLHSSQESMEKYGERVLELERAFKDSGKGYDCPIYGKVMFDGEECVPCSA